MNFNISNEYIPITLPKEYTETSSDVDNAGLLLIACACNLYREKFNSNEVPFSFIDFYINEMANYSKTFNKPLQEFFIQHKKKNSLEMYIRMYLLSSYNVAKGIKNTDGYQSLILDSKNNFYIKDCIEDAANETERTVAENLSAAYNQYKKNDELKTISELYDDFLIEKFIENYNNVEHHEIKDQSNPIIQENKRLNTTLVGTKNEIPNQNGRIVQLNIPSFELPMSFPIDFNHSRILSEYKAKRFAYADKCIKIINKHRISAIGFSVGFVEKRKSVKKKKNFDKFGFDF